MNGYDIFKKSLIRLSLTKFEEKLSETALEYLNDIAADLKLCEIKNLNDSFELTSGVKEALTYGLMMLITLNVGDTAQNKLYTDLYNAKRALVLSSKDTIEDILPKTEGVV